MAVQTQIQTRRGTAATWTSTNPTLAAGEIGFESDTGKFKIGTGSTAWASLAYATNGAVVSPLTTKGDLFTYSTTNARLAVGNNGESLVADSSTSTGLRWQGDYAAGKNKIINGDFGVWQRGTSLSITATYQYLADRWQSVIGFGTPTATMSQQTFTPGTAPVAGYEGQYFLRQQVTVAPGGGNPVSIGQRIEDVRTFANQTVTLSFWAKADSARTWSTRLIQNFGSGGSADVTTSGSSLSVTTGWTRFTQTFTLPSISGKTIGTSSYLYLLIDAPVNTVQIMDIWGVQLEAGNVATAFQTATGTIQGELAACQRYYVRWGGQTIYEVMANAQTTSATALAAYPIMPVQMRIVPSAVGASTLAYYDGVTVIAINTPTLNANINGQKMTQINFVGTGFAVGKYCQIIANNSTSAYLELSAEL